MNQRPPAQVCVEPLNIKSPPPCIDLRAELKSQHHIGHTMGWPKANGDDKETGRRRQPSSTTAGSIPARPGAYRVESRAPNRQRRGREDDAPGTCSQLNDAGSRGSRQEDTLVVEAECTAAVQAVALTQSQSEEGQTQVVEALETAVIDDDANGSGSATSPYNLNDRIRKKDWIIVGLSIGVAVIVVAVVLGFRLSR